MVFMLLQWLGSSGGLVVLREHVQTVLDNHSYHQITTTAFNHIMSLSSDFHDKTNSTALAQTVIRGRGARGGVAKRICFWVVPMIVDLALAAGTLYYIFGAYMSLIVAAVAVVGMVTAAQSTTLQLELAAALIITAYKVASGTKCVGSFVMLLSYWAQLSGPLQMLVHGFRDFAKEMVEAEELMKVLHQDPAITDSPSAQPLVCKEEYFIDFKKVRFSYDGERIVLKDINFHVPAGKKTAIVGNLLHRLRDPTAGVISIDGQVLSNVTLDSLRAMLGIVSQDTTLFQGTIEENVRFAKLDATHEEVKDACKAAAIHDKIISLPNGYGTMVGDGGELQCVAIARVILKNPKIILLDEATSSLDSETEACVQQGLKQLCAGRIMIVIAHRLSNVMDADQILVVKDGSVVERGTHPYLLNRKGYYYSLCELQGLVMIDKDEERRIIG
ncbi:hypothetical protein BDFG_01482 [Blastomyces dermatitidis ATCC 26199]|nr:hypothetical protein BDFG_01482 [Blastomyces dermatitidis ATCC 26199]